jgi:hypothetical protein
MKSADVFAIVVRSLGLIICIVSGAVLYWGFINLVFGGPNSVAGSLIMGGPPLLVGLWLLRGAPGLIRFAYPDAERYSTWQFGLRTLFLVTTVVAFLLGVAVLFRT